MRLKNKVAIVTGSSRGIGRGIALAFAKEGAKVVINYLKSHGDARGTVQSLKEIGVESFAFQADVSDEDQVEEMVRKTLDEFGKIDILVNNAGGVVPFSFEEPDYGNWQRMVDVHLKALLICSRAVSRSMLEQKSGVIIDITVYDQYGSLDYLMTKNAANNITRGLARKLAPYIRVNAIAPGYITTWGTEEERKAIAEQIPLKRWGTPEDIGKVAAFLASDDSSYMTGAVVVVDGGSSLVRGIKE